MKRWLLRTALSCCPYGSRAFWFVFPYAWLADDGRSGPAGERVKS